MKEKYPLCLIFRYCGCVLQFETCMFRYERTCLERETCPENPHYYDLTLSNALHNEKEFCNLEKLPMKE